MSRHLLFAIGGVIAGLILLAWLPGWLIALIIVAAIAIPATAYFMLDPSQRRRLREQRRRRQLGR
jgi:membrane protein implicated in regulation of membrane protease activity